MNYQPYFDMNILISEPLLIAVTDHPIAIGVFIFLALCLPFLSILTVISLIRHFFFRPVRIYPPHSFTANNN
jgi:hypothetical protein